jgi:hypothetical protein
VDLKSLEHLRALLYNALDKNEKEDIIRLSQELDEVIVYEMKKITRIKIGKTEKIYIRGY